MSEVKVYKVPDDVAENAYIDAEKYKEMYERSINDSDAFWEEQANAFLSWFSKWDKIQKWDYTNAEINWFAGGKLNVSYNCLDRHLEERGEQVAIIWEGDDPDVDKKISYRELHEEVCKLANVFKSRGV